ncbi:bifunctional 3'-5' exonuclease/DNA polymerase [Eubacterium pyruvativorans]|uniref:bifunctional 3'-5' exonuclease/DNA polymerase n=1 Tax=Eubacterium pyruvativorans TaxID=155865 RepID=UPI001568AC4A|nr:bifunctional 3'-5' exonuclease/DNA polymerase [Eubacterium pyruvativorans]
MDYRCVTEIPEIRRYLNAAEEAAFDFETAPDDGWKDEEKAALDAHKSHIVGVSFSVKEESAIYVPLKHKIGKNADEGEILKLLSEFAVSTRTKIAHNLAFEAMFLYKHGVVIQAPVYDTMCAAQMTLKTRFDYRNLRDSGLKILAPTLCGADMPHFEEVTKGRSFDEMDPQDFETVRYACADSDYTLRLYHLFNRWFERNLPKHRHIVESLESPAAVYVGMMKYNGVLMNREEMFSKQAEAMKKIMELREQIDAITGGVEIGTNASTSAFKKYLYQDLGLPVLKTTAKHQEAADDEALLDLKEYCLKRRPELVRLFDLITEYRKWQKLKSTYIDGYIRYINDADGRIHSDLQQLKTATGRFACQRPNMQNQVAAGADPIGVRNFMIASPGYVLLEADYSQVELRICAYVSQDRTMLDAYANGEDIHAITTSAVFGIPLAEAKDHSRPDYKKRRTTAKSTMFGIMYGIGPQGLARNLRVNAGITHSTEECKSYIDGIKQHYTGLAQWQKDVVVTARNDLFSETKMGRRRYLPEIRSNDYGKRRSAERMAMNSPIQGLAADTLKAAMARLVAALADKPWIRPTMTVHDSLVFEIQKDRISKAAAVIKKCMEEPLFPDMPALVAEVAVGDRYGELEDL